MNINENSEINFPTNQHAVAEEVAPYLRTSKAVVYEWYRQGKFPPNVAFRIGRKILFHRANLELWIANGGTAQIKGTTAK